MLNIIRKTIRPTNRYNQVRSITIALVKKDTYTLNHDVNIKKYEINGYKEEVLDINNLNTAKCLMTIKDDIISVLGYGPQGRGQSLNLRDNGYPVILGLRKNGHSWNSAILDGWTEHKDLFEIGPALKKGTIIKYLLSDAGQISEWDLVKNHLTENKTLYFSHGFGIVYKDQTKIIPPKNIDVIMVAPKGPGGLVRENFLKKNQGINASYAIHQDYTGTAMDKCLALSYGIGSKNLFETTFKKEVYSDLLGERCVLMGMIQGAFKAQYDVLRENGHSPIEAFNETVEEALQSLYPLINKNGMDWMFSNCSTTAQRGALDWSNNFYNNIKPIIKECYNDVKSGKESQIVIRSNSDSNHRTRLERELEEINNQEIWKTGKFVRELRNK